MGHYGKLSFVLNDDDTSELISTHIEHSLPFHLVGGWEHFPKFDQSVEFLSFQQANPPIESPPRLSVFLLKRLNKVLAE